MQLPRRFIFPLLKGQWQVQFTVFICHYLFSLSDILKLFFFYPPFIISFPIDKHQRFPIISVLHQDSRLHLILLGSMFLSTAYNQEVVWRRNWWMEKGEAQMSHKRKMNMFFLRHVVLKQGAWDQFSLLWTGYQLSNVWETSALPFISVIREVIIN